LVAFFVIAMVLRVGVAIYSPSIEYPDEIFESLEPAHRLAYGYGVVSWEWTMGVRSWVFPAFLAGVMRATAWMGQGSRGYLDAIIVVLSLISLTTVWFGFAWCRRADSEPSALLAAGACAIWAPLIYFAPKAFNEVLAGNLFLPGLYLGIYGGGSRARKWLFLAGLFCGLAMSLRIQLAPAAVFAVLYFCRSEWRSKVPPLLAGLLLPVAVFGLVDAFTWSYPFQSFFRYFWVNIVVGKSSFYGIRPWYWYLSFLVKYLGPLLLLAVAGVRRSPLLGWVTLVIVATHSLIGHKEGRFLYPVIPILITLAALGFVEVAGYLRTHTRLHLPPRAIVAYGLLLFALCSAFVAAHFPRWHQASGGLISMDRLSTDPSVCGVGLYRIPWAWTGGYVHLHQNVPLILVLKDAQLEVQHLGFNALVAEGTPNVATKGFKPEGCWNGACLYRRSGPCISSLQYNEVNDLLRHGYQ
jgi:hypothetical protein